MTFVSVIIIIVFLIQLGLCIFLGLRKGIVNSAIDLGFNIISSVLAVLTTKGIAYITKNIFQSISAKAIKGQFTNPNGTEIFSKGTGVSDAISLFSSTLAVICAYFIIYLLIYFIMKIPKHFLNKSLKSKNLPDKNQTVSKIGSPIITVISGLLSLILVLSPCAASVMAFDKGSKDSISYNNSRFSDLFAPVTDNFVLKLSASCGGNAAFNFMTGIQKDGHQITPTNEITSITALLLSTMDLASDKLTSTEIDEILSRTSTSFRNSELLPEIIGDTASKASFYWLDDKCFLDQSFSIPDSRTGAIYTCLFEIMEKWDGDAVRDDFSTVLDLVELINDQELSVTDMKEDKLPAYADEEFLYQLFKTLFDNNDFKTLLPVTANAGMGMVCDKLEIPFPKDFSSDIDLDNLTDDDLRNEASILAGISKVVLSIEKENNGLDVTKMNAAQIIDLSNAMYNLKDSYFLKAFAADILKNLAIALGVNSQAIANDISDVLNALTNQISNYSY